MKTNNQSDYVANAQPDTNTDEDTGTLADTASKTSNESDGRPFFEGSCEWSEQRNSFDMQWLSLGYLSTTWSANRDVDQNEYIGAAKFRVSDVALVGGTTEDVVIDIDLRNIDLQSESWIALDEQDKAVTFVYDEDGSRCVSPASCTANLTDIQRAIKSTLTEKYPEGYAIVGEASFLGVFLKLRVRQKRFKRFVVSLNPQRQIHHRRSQKKKKALHRKVQK